MHTLLVVHHSHTDIGYTETQARIERWHVDFLRQAVEIADRRRDFRWVCETFWPVERFLERVTTGEAEALAEAIHRGRIGLSASYLNFSELVGEDVLRAVTARAGRCGDGMGVPVTCAMTADVNGFGWGFADALLDTGVESLFTCIHTHHGMYPLGRTQTPFWWEAPSGRHVLVWSGEHYHFGNELGLAPGAVSSYLTKDECDADMIFGDHRRVAEIRIPRYVHALCERGHPFDFVPVMVSGLRNDNAPPNEAILDAVEWWNETHAAGTGIDVEMATLEDVFRRLRESGVELPVHRGDWPDWWSDGPASRPKAVRLYRRAQRDLVRLRALQADRRRPADLEEIETNLALFAEHTFSHSDAMASPWYPMVHAIDARKEAYAAEAAGAIDDHLDAERERRGGASLRPGVPLLWEVSNPFDGLIADLAALEVGHYEFEELGLGRGFEAVDDETGEPLPVDLVGVPRGGAFLVPLELSSSARRRIRIVPTGNGRRALEPGEAGTSLETAYAHLAWRHDAAGVAVWRDERTGRSLLAEDALHAPLQPVRDVTPVPDRSAVGRVRGEMVLNRKGPDANRSEGRLVDARESLEGATFRGVTLGYEVAGCAFLEVVLRAHRYEPVVDASVRLHKQGTWEPENLYLALPFSAGAGAVLWLDKAGAALRPRVDQIPGTSTDYYAVQGGFASVGEDLGVAVAMLDQHLLQLGPLAYGERLLMGDPRLADVPSVRSYAWAMTNYWETNFAADLGGFVELRYRVAWGPDLADPEAALRRTRLLGQGFEVVRLATDPRG